VTIELKSFAEVYATRTVAVYEPCIGVAQLSAGFLRAQHVAAFPAEITTDENAASAARPAETHSR
jgi:hypothetical protein